MSGAATSSQLKFLNEFINNIIAFGPLELPLPDSSISLRNLLRNYLIWESMLVYRITIENKAIKNLRAHCSEWLLFYSISKPPDGSVVSHHEELPWGAYSWAQMWRSRFARAPHMSSSSCCTTVIIVSCAAIPSLQLCRSQDCSSSWLVATAQFP